MNCENFKMFSEAKESESASFYIPTIDELIKSNQLPVLVQCLVKEYGTLKCEAALAVGNLVTGISGRSNKVIDACTVPLLVQLLSSSLLEESEKLVATLANLIYLESNLLNFMVEGNFVKPIVSLIKPGASTSLLRVVAEAIYYLCSDEDVTLPLKTILEILPAINMLLDHTDDKILQNVVMAVEFLSNDNDQFVIGSGVVPKLVPLLGHADCEVQKHALEALSDLSKRSVRQQQLVAEYDIVSYFPALLSHEDEEIRSGASNFFLYHCIKEATVSNGLLKKIIGCLSETESQKQFTAVSTILTFVNCHNRFTFHVIKEGAIPPLYDLLKSNQVKILQGALACLFHIFETKDHYVQQAMNWMKEYDGLERIRNYQNHEDTKISRFAHSIIDQQSSYLNACN